MVPASTPHSHPVAPHLLSPDADSVLESARALQHAAETGATQALLRGKVFALLCESDDAGNAELFRSASTDLGAHVAQVRAGLSLDSSADEIHHTARLLGQLYDAVQCEGMPSALVKRIGAEAGIPVYDSLSSASHPMSGFAERLGGTTIWPSQRRFVLQALLVAGMR